MKSSSFRMRTFGVGANHEIVLPNGKVVLIDPAFHEAELPGFTLEDVTGADYIVLTHSHYDHDIDIGYFVGKFNSRVFCGAMAAEALMKYHKIPFDNLFAVYPNNRYTLEDVTFEFWQAKHNPAPGRVWTPELDTCRQLYGLEGHAVVDMWGSMESLDFMLTTNNGFRVMMASGQTVFQESFDRCKELRPNVLLRQAGFRNAGGEQVSARELAELLVRYGAQVIFPFHFDVLLRKWKGHEKVAAYMEEVAAHVRELDCGAMFIMPEALKWYSIGIDVSGI